MFGIRRDVWIACAALLLPGVLVVVLLGPRASPELGLARRPSITRDTALANRGSDSNPGLQAGVTSSSRHVSEGPRSPSSAQRWLVEEASAPAEARAPLEQPPARTGEIARHAGLAARAGADASTDMPSWRGVSSSDAMNLPRNRARAERNPSDDEGLLGEAESFDEEESFAEDDSFDEEWSDFEPRRSRAHSRAGVSSARSRARVDYAGRLPSFETGDEIIDILVRRRVWGEPELAEDRARMEVLIELAEETAGRLSGGERSQLLGSGASPHSAASTLRAFMRRPILLDESF